METWMKIGSAILIIMMIVFIWPSARHWLKNSPKGDTQQWVSALIPLALVVGFVVLLVALV